MKRKFLSFIVLFILLLVACGNNRIHLKKIYEDYKSKNVFDDINYYDKNSTKDDTEQIILDTYGVECKLFLTTIISDKADIEKSSYHIKTIMNKLGIMKLWQEALKNYGQLVYTLSDNGNYYVMLVLISDGQIVVTILEARNDEAIRRLNISYVK